MFRPTGSWVAMPTPFRPDNSIDYDGFRILIERQIKYGTSELFVLGSCGEVSLLTIEEKKAIVKEVVRMTKGKIPVFFNASSNTTDASVEFAKYVEGEGGGEIHGEAGDGGRIGLGDPAPGFGTEADRPVAGAVRIGGREAAEEPDAAGLGGELELGLEPGAAVVLPGETEKRRGGSAAGAGGDGAVVGGAGAGGGEDGLVGGRELGARAFEIAGGDAGECVLMGRGLAGEATLGVEAEFDRPGLAEGEQRAGLGDGLAAAGDHQPLQELFSQCLAAQNDRPGG